ncbi:hypothetical protein BH20ACI1_BH20ACI1_27060 [soil metagenome]
MIFNVEKQAQYPHRVNVRIKCPNCRHKVNLEKLDVEDLQFSGKNETFLTSNNKIAGLRKCPNEECNALVFFVVKPFTHIILVSFPYSTIEFDVTDIPEEIVKCFNESLICHSNECYVASAIMVRKTLEIVCKKNGAVGKNLKDKITDLGKKITLSRELLDGFDELRILGNNAVHVEAKEFDDVGKEEVEIAIDVTKEILKAVYQHKELVGRLRNLKKNTTP